MFTLDPIQNLKGLISNQDLLKKLTTRPSVDLDLLEELLAAGDTRTAIEDLCKYHHSDTLAGDQPYPSNRTARISAEVGNEDGRLYNYDILWFWRENKEAINKWLSEYSQPAGFEPKLVAITKLLNSTRYNLNQKAFSDDQVAKAIYGNDLSNDGVADVIKTIIKTLVVSVIETLILANNGHEYEGIPEGLIGFIASLGTGRFFTSNDLLVKIFLNKFDAIAFHDTVFQAALNKTDPEPELDGKEMIAFFSENKTQLINWMDELNLDSPSGSHLSKIRIVTRTLEGNNIDISYDDTALAMYSSDPKDFVDDVALIVTSLFVQGLSLSYKGFITKHLILQRR